MAEKGDAHQWFVLLRAEELWGSFALKRNSGFINHAPVRNKK